MALWRAEQVEAKLHRELTADEATRLIVLGPLIEAAAVAYLRTHLELTAVLSEEHRVASLSTEVRLYATPIVSVQSVTLDGVVLDSAAYEHTDGTLIYSASAAASTATSLLVVSYTAGLSAQFDAQGYQAIAGVLASRLARELRMGRAGIGEELQSVGVEGESMQLAGGVRGIAGFNADERDTLDNFRRRRFR